MKATVLGCAVVLAAALACSKEAKDPAAYCAVEAPQVTTRAGGTVHARVRFVPVAGWRWNADFAAGAKVTSPAGLIPDALSFGPAAFQPDADGAVLSVPVTTARPGPATLGLAVDYSVCSPDGCQDFHGVPVNVRFLVQ